MVELPSGMDHERRSRRRGDWPWRVPARDTLPPRLPSGRPWPRISIITPSMNLGHMIEETILSVLNQGYPDVEHIIMDAGSTDATPAILDKYADRLARVVREPDNGQSDAINKGMRLATGDVLTWLNGDDMLAPGALHAMALAFAEGDVDLVAGVATIIRHDRPAFHHLPVVGEGPLSFQDMLDVHNAWLGERWIQPQALFSKDLWHRAGGHVREDLHFTMDYELWVRFAEAGARVRVIGSPACLYRRHPGQKTFTAGEATREGEGVAQVLRQRHGLDAPPPPRPFARRNPRLCVVNDLPLERLGACARVHRLATALGEAWWEVLPVFVGDAPGAKPGPLAEDTLRRVGFMNPDVVMIGAISHLEGAAGFVATAASRWPLVFLPEGADLAAHAPDGVVLDEVVCTGGDSGIMAPGPLRDARHRLNIPRGHDVVCVLGGTGQDAGQLRTLCQDLMAAGAGRAAELYIISDSSSVPADRVIDWTQTTDTVAADIFRAADLVLALSGTGRSRQAAADAALCGAPVLALPDAALPGLGVVGGYADLVTAAGALLNDAERQQEQAAFTLLAAGNRLGPRRLAYAVTRVLIAKGILARIGMKEKLDFRPAPTPLPPSLPGAQGW